MNRNLYEIKVLSGSKSGVDNLIRHELEEYPKEEYGTIVLNLDENDYMKTVRIVRFKTKELFDGRELKFKQGQYPFDSGISL